MAARSPRQSRSEARDAQARERLRPLAPGERPLALKLATALAVLIALSNLVLLAGGWEVSGSEASASGSVVFFALMAACAAGLWLRSYWAVLGFEALLGVTMCWAALSLLVAANAVAVALCVVILVLCGPLFWGLIRVMGRLRSPELSAR